MRPTVIKSAEAATIAQNATTNYDFDLQDFDLNSGKFGIIAKATSAGGTASIALKAYISPDNTNWILSETLVAALTTETWASYAHEPNPARYWRLAVTENNVNADTVYYLYITVF